jgi:hypothetical protein
METTDAEGAGRLNEPFCEIALLTGRKLKLMMSLLKNTFLVMGISTTLLAAAPREDINPALIYYKAFAVVPELSEAEHDYLFKGDWRGKQLDNHFGELIAKYDNEFKLFRKAASAKAPCDWGIDLSEGPEVLMPGLAKAKFATQVMRLRALWFLQNNNESDAINDLLSTFVLARQVSRDGVLISALVQIAMENITCNFIAENFGRFSDEGLKAIVEGMQNSPRRGTLRECLPTERAGFRDWFINKIEVYKARNNGDEAGTIAEIRRLYLANMSSEGENDPGFVDRWLSATGGTSEGILSSLRDLDAYYDEADRILQLPFEQFETAAKAFHQKIESDPRLIAGKLLPYIEKCGVKDFGGVVKLAMVRAAVEYKINGEAGFQSIVDPVGGQPFGFERVGLNGIDRGFQLKSKLPGVSQVLIFIQTEGAPLNVDGPKAGKPISSEK